MKTCLSALILVGVSFLAGCDNKPDAPFGLKWGQSVKETIGQNLKGAKVDGDENLVVFIHADSAPEPVQYRGRYFFVFSSGEGLTSASFSTQVDENGVFFNEGRSVYDSISKKLEEKYGPPKFINEKVDRDGPEFYSCIKEDGCGLWERSYRYDGMDIKLSVKPTPGKLMDGFAKAYINVEYEYLTDEMKKKMFDKMKKQNDSNNF